APTAGAPSPDTAPAETLPTRPACGAGRKGAAPSCAQRILNSSICSAFFPIPGEPRQIGDRQYFPLWRNGNRLGHEAVRICTRSSSKIREHGIEMTRSNCSMLLAGAPLVLALGVPALAADLAVKAPIKAPLAASYSWTGWYIGANAGY